MDRIEVRMRCVELVSKDQHADMDEFVRRVLAVEKFVLGGAPIMANAPDDEDAETTGKRNRVDALIWVQKSNSRPYPKTSGALVPVDQLDSLIAQLEAMVLAANR